MTNAQCRMTNDAIQPLEFDLEERTARFGEAVIDYCLTVPETSVSRPLITQLVRAATSVGANYAEADNAESKADFRHKIALCRKEARETKHWCRMLSTIPAAKTDALRQHWTEAKELHLIFSKTIRTTDANLRDTQATPRRRTP
jgi:four helix bundle protein